MALITDLSGNSEILIGYDDAKRKRRVNGEREMSLTLYRTPQNAHYFDDISYLWTVDYAGDEYVIVGIYDTTYGDSYSRELSLLHRFYHDLRNIYRYEQVTGSRTFFDCLTFILNGTGYTFNIVGNFLAQEFENFGDSSVLDLFQTALERYGAEFTVIGNVVTLREEIGSSTDFQYRHKFNIRNVKRELDALDFSTYGKAFGKNGLVVEYQSPLYETFGKLEYPAIRDDRYTVADSLYARLKNEIDASLKIAITFEFEDMRATGYPGDNPSEGDHVLLFEERMNIAIDTRIVEIEETFNEREEVIACNVTLSNFTNLAEQQSQMENAVKKVADLLDGKTTLPFSALDNAVQNATRALQSAQTELIFDNGIISLDKTNNNKLVVLNSAGLGISSDGGQTFRTAMTGEGIVADVITVGTLRGIIIEGVEVRGSTIISSDVGSGDLTQITGGKVSATGSFTRDFGSNQTATYVSTFDSYNGAIRIGINSKKGYDGVERVLTDGRALIFTDKTVTSQRAIHSASVDKKGARFIDFFANETLESDVQGLGMHIYSGQDIRIEAVQSLSIDADTITLKGLNIANEIAQIKNRLDSLEGAS